MTESRVPLEFRKAGIKTPEEAADYAADIIGVISVERMRDSMKRAEAEGRTLDAEFYEAVLAILLDGDNAPVDDPLDDLAPDDL